MVELDTNGMLHAVIETAVDGIVLIDGVGTVLLFNHACERLFLYPASDVLGRNVKMLMPSPYQGEHDSYLSHHQETGVRRIIGKGRRVEGRRADASVFPMYLSVGEVAGAENGALYIGIIHDLTEQHAVEQALREQSERLRSVLETVPDALVVIDDRGIIESFSPAAERLFGWNSNEVQGRNVSMLMPSPYREQHDSYLSRYALTGERRIIGIGRVVVGQRRDGSTFPMELAVGEMSAAPGHSFTGFVRDLTERQGTEKRLQELQMELLHVSRLSAMGQMASALAHELNQPLTAIINWTQVARRVAQDAKELAPPRLIEFLDRAVEQADRAGEIIRRLRNFVGRGETERHSEDVNKVMEEAVALALVGAKETGVRVSYGLRPGLPPVVIDKIQIQQVMINLIRNAVEAMQEVTTRELAIETRFAGTMVEVSVANSGPGLDPMVLEKLFQPFITTKETGMGLGLSICRSIIDNHAGRLQAAPGPVRGTVFTFTLPIAALG